MGAQATPQPAGVPSSAASSSALPNAAQTTYQPLGPATPEGYVPKVTLSIPMGPVAAQTAKDMAEARAKTAFSPERIEEVLRDSRIDNAARHGLVEVLHKDQLFGNWKKKMLHLNREQKMAMSHVACRRLLEIGDREGWSTHEIVDAAIALDLQNPISIHWIAFVPVIMGQGDNDQVERWANRAMNHEIMGCYLQTELGHGTNVQMLETTATYDAATDTFDLHSPTLTSTKWWAGGSGRTATHGIVQAQLIINGKRYGPHLFFTALRSVINGELLPGIVGGDIGPKTYDAFGGLDNGWMRFDHVKLPRTNMLSKHSKVLKGGEYVRPPSDKLSYGGMIFIRSQMIDRAGWMLSRGATITTRYSLVRRQFHDPDDTGRAQSERSVWSYPSLHRRIFPYISKSFAYIVAGRRMRTLYEDMAAALETGDTTLLADVHVASSSLKAYCTKQVVEGLEECRQALGGHGFSAYSGFSSLYPDQLPAVTYEGDNIVLMQQVGRAMLKTTGLLAKDPKTPVSNTLAFLRAVGTPNAIPFKAPSSPQEWLRPETLSAVLGLRAARRVADLAAEVRSGRRFVDLSYECIEVAKSHAEVVVDTWFTEGVRDDAETLGDKEAQWLSKVVILHAITCVARDLTPLTLPAAGGRSLAGYEGKAILTPESVLHLETATRQIIEELMPQAIGLTDSFGWTDWELGSALGRKDGRVYEQIMAEAEANPVNHPTPEDAANPRNLGVYRYGSKDIGNHVAETWRSEVEPWLRAGGKRSDDGPIRGDGSKL